MHIVESPRKESLRHSLVDALRIEQLVEACRASDDVRFKGLGNALIDPVESQADLLDLMRRNNITFASMVDFWREHYHFLGVLRMMPGIPDVYADVVEDAKSKDVACSKCKGEGKVVDPKNKDKRKTCTVCRGKGTIRQIGDPLARKIVFESMKMIGNRGPIVKVEQNNYTMPGRMQDTSTRVSQILDATPIRQIEPPKPNEPGLPFDDPAPEPAIPYPDVQE
ncbi:MAG TPA: zinc finger-like domain-containing protein [Candidatus Sulfotelmatobacter sp.]|nr:zinc finger-like domain-containing protein [Candidatus Sulfotelmatobacter sp.]